MTESSAMPTPTRAAPTTAAPATAVAAPGRGDALANQPFTRYQRFIVALLAFLQFTVVLDFMVLSPLGALLMRDLQIPTSRFGLVVSAYAFSAGASGILAAGFADRFDRKRLLLFFYTGFVAGTFLCALAGSFTFLLVARMVTGLFGGVLGAVIFAIVADLFPLAMRGRVMGFVQTAFAASQVMGIPVSVALSSRWGWHAPFLVIAVVATAVGVVIALYMRPIDAHLGLQRPGNPFVHLFRTVSQPFYLRAFATTTLLVTGGFMLMPFGSAYAQNNLGIPFERQWIIYVATGASSIVAGPFLGRLSDVVGKYRLFLAGSALTMVMVLVYTRLPTTSIPVVVAVSIPLFVGITSRMISASALMSAVPAPADRGAFMGVNASIQQIAGGIASAAAGMIVVQTESGRLGRYDVLGYVVVSGMTITAALLYFIHKAVVHGGGRGAASG